MAKDTQNSSSKKFKSFAVRTGLATVTLGTAIMGSPLVFVPPTNNPTIKETKAAGCCDVCCSSWYSEGCDNSIYGCDGGR